MNPFADADVDALLDGSDAWGDPETLAALAEHPLESVDTEYPHYVHALEGPDDVTAPSDQHPVFYGCFDWHSAVHSHWTLVRLLRLFEDHPDEAAIEDSIEGRLTPENVAGERAYFEENESFENPYGWGWLLRLAAELHLWDDPRGDEWRATLAPLEDRIADLVEREFLARGRPIRVGTHGNSAFGLACVLDYARVVGDETLESAAAATAREWYVDDTDYNLAYEPLGWDFVSPGLAEADLLCRVLDAGEFADWLEGFLPGLADDPAATLPDPVAVDADDGDGAALHLVGLDLSRAWCLAGMAETLGDRAGSLGGRPATDDHPAVDALEASARAHAEAGLQNAFTDDYAGAHWLSSFVCYLLTREEDGIAPA